MLRKGQNIMNPFLRYQKGGENRLDRRTEQTWVLITFCPSNDGVKKETRQKKFPPCLFFKYADKSSYSVIISCSTSRPWISGFLGASVLRIL